MKKVFLLGLTISYLFASNEFLSNMPEHGPGHNVHVLDTHVEAHLPGLLQMARALDFGNPNLSQQEAQAILDVHVPEAITIDGARITHDVIATQHIPRCLVTAYANDLTKELYSRLVSASTSFGLLIESICENYATQGGCAQGVRNRGAIVFALALDALYNPASGA